MNRPLDVTEVTDHLIRHSWGYLQAPDCCAAATRAAAAWKPFFRSEEKLVHQAKAGALEGYFPLYSERAVGAQDSDPKEYYHVYDPQKAPGPLVLATAEVFECAVGLAKTIFDVLHQRLDLSLNVDFLPGGGHLMRVIEYPPAQSPTLAAPHTDITLFTLGLYSDTEGLYVTDNSGKTIKLRSEPRSVLVLAGDMLEIATRKRIKAAKHWVANTDSARVSLVFFANPPNNVYLTPTLTAGDALLRRLREMGTSEV